MTDLSRTVLRLVTGALCVAALVAIVAILSGDFSDGDLKVIGTSVLFAIAVSAGAAGARLRLRGADVDVALGTVVAVASAAAFVFVTYGMWVEVDDDAFWRASWSLAIVALDGALACLVLAARRTSDTEGVGLATAVAAWSAAVSATIGVLAAVGVAEDGPWQLLATVLVVQVLATTLTPILRRLARQASAPAPDLHRAGPQPDVANRLNAIADALDAAASPAAVRSLADQIRRVANEAPGH